MRRRDLDRPVVAGALTAALVLAFVLVRLWVDAGSIGGFVVAGDAFTAPEAGLPLAAGHGYDGQFVWRLAHDPWTHRESAYGVGLDAPPYRQQRVALPALAWALHGATGLSHELLLLLVNCLAVVGVGVAGAVLARRLGRHALWGVALALSAGILTALARDLNEPLAALGLLTGLALWTGDRWRPAILPFCLGVLARETTLAVLAGLGLWGLWEVIRRRAWRGLPRVASLLVPLAVAVAWQLYVAGIWGRLPITANDGNLGTPVVGVAQSLLRGLADLSGSPSDVVLRHLWLVERVGLLVALVYLLLRLGASRVPADLRAGFVLAALLALTTTSWRADVQFWRAANEAVLMGLVVAMGLPQRPRYVLLGGSVASSLAVAAVHGLAL